MPTPRTRLGNRGEELARQYLERQGYRVVARNYRCAWGEIDLVAQEGEELVFVEVRTRRGDAFGTPEESITPAKARHLVASAQEYLQERGPENAPWRIDFIGIRLDPRPDQRQEAGRSSPRIHHLKHAVEL